MSITPYPLKSLTGLIPSIVYGVNNAGTRSLEMNYDNGLTMNVAGEGIAIQDLNGNSITSAGGDINLTTPPTGKTYINYSTPNIGDGELVCSTISGAPQLLLSASDIITNCQAIQLDAGNEVNLNSTGGVINLTTPPTGKTYINYSVSNIGDGELVCAQISYQYDININAGEFLYLSANNDITLSSFNGKINANNDIVMKDNTEPTWNTELSTGGLSFDIGGTYSVNIDAEGGGVISTTYNNGTNTLYGSLTPSQIQLDDGTIVNTITQNSMTIVGSDLSLTAENDINLISTTGTINAYTNIAIKDAGQPTWNTEISVGGLSFSIDNTPTNTKNITLDAEGGASIYCSLDNGVSTDTTAINPFQIQIGDGTIVNTINKNSMTIEADDLTLTAGNNIFMNSGNTGNIILTTNDTTGDLVFNGLNLQKNSSGGNSGEFLRIKLNGVYYRIALEND
jgi:hypothetical protein